VTIKPSISGFLLAVDPRDRLLTSVDPIWRATKRRFGPLVIAVLLFHLTIIAILILDDRLNKNDNIAQTEIPVEVIVQPPPPPPPPPPEKKVEQEKKPPPEKQKYLREEKPAFDAPRTPNNETLKRQITDNQTRSPVQAQPAPANDTKPVEAPKPAQNAAPEPAENTAAPEKPEDSADAEPLDKSAPTKAAQAKQKMKQARERAPLPDDQRAAVARQLASLTQSPDYSIAAEAKVAPVTGGTEDMRYLSVLYGLIMRQQHFPQSPHRHTNATAVVAFWIDETGALVHTALYRTSGYPELDKEAVAAVRRAAPFPEPPVDEPHGFIASMVFPPN